ncbi:cytochrome c oxidase subunit 4 [Carnobacterium iners]|uniref:Cytochrome c oxidase subunit 4 n=1 Tax=Carnobacterium iners TaxID=1073423 RepID=A0A1X7MSJ7_9LACT|nr:hypothetical protein [Carnobacterium iners]SEL24041.1 cytochrome c oxidase subunit 4 [Carnobacterium iners]SMH27006.1 cytochrome c oxidase subunit 4 [Carnobacterium iners]
MFSSFDYFWLNVGSLVLGLTAWIIPVVSIMQRKKKANNHSTMILLSMGACAIALWFQLSYNNYLVEINDLPALMDTIGTLNWVAAILLVVTIGLNIISLVSNGKIEPTN